MPVYLIHGFRWLRQDIREHVVMHNIDDAAPEWIIAPHSSKAILEDFRQSFPQIMANLPQLRLLEQFDLEDESISSQPYAYVADVVHQIKLGIDVDEVRGKGLKNDQWGALIELRDKVCRRGAHVAWYVVVCGDEERLAPPITPPLESFGYREWHSNGHTSPSQETETQSMMDRAPPPKRERSNSFSRGMRRIFGGSKDLKKSKSLKDLKNPDSGYYSSSDMPPDLPGTAR